MVIISILILLWTWNFHFVYYIFKKDFKNNTRFAWWTPYGLYYFYKHGWHFEMITYEGHQYFHKELIKKFRILNPYYLIIQSVIGIIITIIIL